MSPRIENEGTRSSDHILSDLMSGTSRKLSRYLDSRLVSADRGIPHYPLVTRRLKLPETTEPVGALHRSPDFHLPLSGSRALRVNGTTKPA